MPNPPPRLTETDHQTIREYVHHMAQCRSCSRSGNIQATFYGCMVGHMWAVRAAKVLLRYYPLPEPRVDQAPGGLF